ncbi:MAG: hypothetical protein HDS66_09665 [Bacteroidales bacterium]|nr:hypothetical protein [Bacteroidales bacterium]
MATIMSSIVSIMVIAFVMTGVVLALLLIHFLSVYFKGDKDPEELVSELKALRREAGESDGISRHSLFYSFFFRER